MYFLLAAFDLFTVLLSLAINYQIRSLYTQSVEVNQVWGQRLADYSALGQLAAEVNGPGNDVFDSHDVASEARRLDAALGAFELRFSALREEVRARTSPAEAALLAEDFDAVAAAMREMTEEARLIFSYFEADQPELAGRRMATMDRKYASLNAALAGLRQDVAAIQQAHFAEQEAIAARLGGFDYLTGLLVLLMVSAATLYGHKVSRQAEAHAREREQHIEQLGEAEARFRALVQNGAELVAILGPGAAIRYASPAAESLLGREVEEVLGQCLAEHVHPEDDAPVRQALEEVAADTAGERIEAFRLRHRDGSWRYVEAIFRNEIGTPGIGGIVINARNVSERKALEDQLVHRALHDELTELPNRRLLVDRLRQALARGARSQQRTAVLFIDLDDFKVVNDSLGHALGDQLLVATAQRLRASVRPGDTVARLGGDEFIVLLEDLGAADDASAAAERILAQLGAPVQLAGREVFVGASIGVALSGSESALPDDLLRDADAAMYAAKARGKGHHELFEPGMHSQPLERLELEADLRRALERGELCLHYQPIVELDTGRISGLEALLRWQHPERGLVPPGAFIPLAEETGLIVPIGRWALREACRQAQAWAERSPTARPAVMSVNLSGRQFQHPGLVEDVAEALRAAGLPASLLKLEITESVAMEAGIGTIQTLQALKGLGVQLAIDDFGTGYSSLAYLKRFPIDTLKIDCSFVNGLGQDPQDTAIVRSVITIAKTLNLAVTGEGIETLDQLEALRALDCDEGQGYYFARPRPGELVEHGRVELGETRRAA